MDTIENSSENSKKSHLLRSQEKRKSSVILKALMMAAGTFSSRVLGLVREMLFAAYFDRQVTDAFTAAFRLPNMFRRLLGEGSLSVSFQPVVIEAQTEDLKTGGHRAEALTKSMHLFLIGLLLLLVVGGIVFSKQILEMMLSSDYVARVEAFELTLRLTRIMFGFLFFICLFAYYMAIMNANGLFGWPALAPVFFNVAMISSTLFPQDILPTHVDALGWGVLIGGFLQMAVLVGPLMKHGLFPGISWKFHNPDLSRVLRNTLPGMVGLGLMQVTLFVNTNFASALGQGAMSYINWADRLLELPLSLVSVSLGTALLPTLAEYWSQGNKNKMVEISERTLSLNFYVGAMAAVGLYALAEPIVRLLFERGLFTSKDSDAVIAVVRIYSLTLLPVSGVRVLAPAYFAVKNTWYPAVASAVCLAVHIFLAPRLMETFALQGLNLSSFISALLNFSLLILSYSFLVHSFLWKTFLMKSLKTGAAILAMGFSMQGLNHLFFAKAENAFYWLVQVVVVGIAGVLVFALVSYVIKHEDIHILTSRVRTKLKI